MYHRGIVARFSAEDKYFPLYQMSRPPLSPAHASIQWVISGLCPVLKWLESKTGHLCLNGAKCMRATRRPVLRSNHENLQLYLNLCLQPIFEIIWGLVLLMTAIQCHMPNIWQRDLSRKFAVMNSFCFLSFFHFRGIIMWLVNFIF